MIPSLGSGSPPYASHALCHRLPCISRVPRFLGCCPWVCLLSGIGCTGCVRLTMLCAGVSQVFKVGGIRAELRSHSHHGPTSGLSAIGHTTFCGLIVSHAG